ncbi:MAG TPA: ABC transporter permease [Rhodanobacter sp.]|nr:ABC transporter permease [Rhodanobacter sp.]
MNTIATMTAPGIAEPMSRQRLLGAYRAEARSECLRYLRNPGFILPMTLFSTVFYLMFGVLINHGNADAARYLLASYSAFGIIGPGLFGFGVSLAIERDGGLLTLKRALPMPPGAYLLAKMLMATLVAAVIALILLGMAVFVADVGLSAGQMLALFAAAVLGVLPFCAMGLWLGTLIKGQGAPGLVNLVYLPMAFLSGLWFPLPLLPKILQQIAPIWPSYHLDRLAMAAVGMNKGALLPHVLTLVGFTAVFLLLATRRLRRYG